MQKSRFCIEFHSFSNSLRKERVRESVSAPSTSHSLVSDWVCPPLYTTMSSCHELLDFCAKSRFQRSVQRRGAEWIRRSHCTTWESDWVHYLVCQYTTRWANVSSKQCLHITECVIWWNWMSDHSFTYNLLPYLGDYGIRGCVLQSS